MKTKTVLHRHAAWRARQRYGLALTKSLRRAIICAIQGKRCDAVNAVTVRASFVYRSSSFRTIWIVDIEGKDHRVVYDGKRSALTTFLPLEMTHREACFQYKVFWKNRRTETPEWSFDAWKEANKIRIIE